MRFKKQIIIICLFTFLFLPFQINKNQIETSANPLAIPIYIGIKEVITGLLVAGGIAITSKGVHYALVNEVYHQNTDIYDEIMEKAKTAHLQGNTVSLKPYINKITDTISTVYNLTFDDEFIKSINMPDTSVSYASGVYSGGGRQYLFKPSASGVLKVGTDYFTIGQYSVSVGDMVYVQGDSTRTKIYLKDVTGYYCPWNTTVPAPFTWSYNAGCSIPLEADWDSYREANEDVEVSSSLSAFKSGSICADDVLNWDKTWELDDTQSYPIDKEYGSIVLTPDDVLDKPSVDEMETPTTGDTLWDTLFGFLKTLFSPITNLLSSLWDLIKGLFDMLKGLLTSILDLLKSLVKSLVDAIAGLFVPTVALDDVFNLNQNTFFGQVAQVFNFDKLWNLTPKPYEFEVDFPFYDFAAQEQRPYHLEIKFFENKFMKENINLIRNITTYPLLLISIYFVIMHFLPKRDMD